MVRTPTIESTPQYTALHVAATKLSIDNLCTFEEWCKLHHIHQVLYPLAIEQLSCSNALFLFVDTLDQEIRVGDLASAVESGREFEICNDRMLLEKNLLSGVAIPIAEVREFFNVKSAVWKCIQTELMLHYYAKVMNPTNGKWCMVSKVYEHSPKFVNTLDITIAEGMAAYVLEKLQNCRPCMISTAQVDTILQLQYGTTHARLFSESVKNRQVKNVVFTRQCLGRRGKIVEMYHFQKTDS